MMIFTIDSIDEDIDYIVHVVYYDAGRLTGPPDFCYPEEIEYDVSPRVKPEHEDRLHDAVMERIRSEGIRKIR